MKSLPDFASFTRFRLFLVLGLAGSLILINGCGKTKDSEDNWATMSTMVAGKDHAQKAYDFVSTSTPFDRTEFEDKVVNSLNRWSVDREMSAEETAWKPDAMIADLDEQFRSIKAMQKLDRKVFSIEDAQFLRQASWAKSIIADLDDKSFLNIWPPLEPIDYRKNNDDDDPLANALASKHKELSATEAAKLASCLRYFDWTVRTVMLDETHDQLTPEEIDAEKLVMDAEEGTPLPLIGVAGPGYRYHPWQTMLYGKGDYLNRARVFHALCHQKGIDAVLLATEKDGKIQPWLSAVLLGKNLYLFDPLIGMAIPGKDGKIATLADVKNDASILESLDLSVDESLAENREYRVKTPMLENLVALIDASPYRLTRRMKILEKTLSGESQLILSQSPTRIKKELATVGVEKAQIWDVPFKTYQFQEVLNEADRIAEFDGRNRPRIARHMRDEVFVENFLYFQVAKTRFMQGMFDTPRGSTKRSCIRLFSEMRYTDFEIADVTNNQFLLQALNVRVAGQSEADYNRRIQQVASSMQQIRIDASYFLSVSNYESGSPSTAINWLDRVDDFPGWQKWQNGIVYIRGRCNESIGNLDKAIEIYQADKSPQAHGNLLRVRLLKELAAKSKKTSAESEN